MLTTATLASNGGPPPHDYRIVISTILLFCWGVGAVMVARKVKNGLNAGLIQ